MNISNKPCQCRSTNYWADDAIRNINAKNNNMVAPNDLTTLT